MNADERSRLALAAALAASAVQRRLIEHLAAKMLITGDEAYEIYEEALLALEEQQGAEPSNDAVPLARALIERNLRRKRGNKGT